MKYTSNMDFRGLKEKKVYVKDVPFEMDKARAEEIEKEITSQEAYKDFKLTPIGGEKAEETKEAVTKTTTARGRKPAKK